MRWAKEAVLSLLASQVVIAPGQFLSSVRVMVGIWRGEIRVGLL